MPDAAAPVYIDPVTTNNIKLFNSPASASVPGVTTSSGNLNGVSLGNGVCLYRTNFQMDGSVDSQIIIVSKPHRICRIEFSVTDSTGSTPDPTGIDLAFGRLVGGDTGHPLTLFSTGGTLAIDSFTVVAGTGWEQDAQQYFVQAQGVSTDFLFTYLVIQYLS